jgi:flagellar biosynthesis chaperone FliJ
MADRAQLKRIGTVRHLREMQEKQEAKLVAAAIVAVAEAEKLILMIDADCERLRTDLAEGMRNGMASEDVTMSHMAWLELRAKRKLVEEELMRRRVRQAAAEESYRLARISRRQMEKWEEKVGDTIRVEDERKMAVMVDEIAVQRHGWRRT